MRLVLHALIVVDLAVCCHAVRPGSQPGPEGPFDAFAEIQGDWSAYVKDDVKNASTLKPKARLEYFKPGGIGDSATAGFHAAIISKLLEYGLPSAKKVMDMGSGRGALLALFAEFAPHAELIQGIELEDDSVRMSSLEKSQIAFEILVEMAENFRAQFDKQFHGISFDNVNIMEGNVMSFNSDNLQNGTYDVINVGFAVHEVPRYLWRALKTNGAIGMPICIDKQHPSNPCEGIYSIFVKKTATDGVPEAGKADATIDKSVKFVFVNVTIEGSDL